MMNRKVISDRKDITKWLSRLLEHKLSGKYYAKEVSLDFGSKDVKRVDYMQFKPVNTMTVSGIEKGIFICYEIKSCIADYKSGFGQNFIGEQNYFVMTMDLYKQIACEIDSNIGVYVPCPALKQIHDEFENPTELDIHGDYWELKCIRPAHSSPLNRKRSSVELLFCMLRSGK